MKNEIKALGLNLAVDETINGLVCPKCGGGIHKDKSLSITRTALGLLYICFRAKCSMSGFIPTTSNVPPKKSRTTRIKNFDYETTSLPRAVSSLLCKTYSLTEDQLHDCRYSFTNRRVAIELSDPRSYHRGVLSRILPFSKEKPKTIIYPEHESFFNIYYPKLPPDPGEIVLAEDVWSSKRISQLRNSAALLGTNLSLEAITELLNIGITKVYLALDKDALNKALSIRQKYNLYFPEGIHIITWESGLDPKDMADEEFKEVFKNGGICST